MELIYMWVESYRNITKNGYNFSNRFEVNYNEKITINETKRKVDFFEKKVTNISALIGINGSGKTNILDLLGVRREDRLQLGNNLSYFVLYYLEDDFYAIEGQGLNLIKNQISNLPGDPNPEKAISETYALIIKKTNQRLIFEDYLQTDEKEFHESLNVISFRYHYDDFTYKRYRSFEVDNESSVFFKRLNLSSLNSGHQAKFKMLKDLNEKPLNSYRGFEYNSTASLNIEPNIRISSAMDIKIKDFNAKFPYVVLGQSEDKVNANEKKNRFIYRFMQEFCLSIASYIWEGELNYSQRESFTQKFIDYESKISKKTNSVGKTYYFEILKFLLLEYKKINIYIDEKSIENFLTESVEFFESLNADYFNKSNIVIPIGNLTEYKEVLNFLRMIDYNNVFYQEEMKSILTVFNLIYFPLSSGESSLLSLFSSLYYGATLRDRADVNKEKLIILIDEPEQYLHPEWSRLLVNGLVNFLNNIEGGYNSYQVILTTHSPFLLSDLPSENIIIIQKGQVGNPSSLVEINLGETFAANIHTLLSDEFFMSSTIGEFAKIKINEIITFLNEEESAEEFSKEYVDYIISIIGEPVIKRKLELMRDDKYLNFKDREEKIRKLKAELRELESYDSNTRD